ncbi:hypothetical protein MUK42_33414 [Musa troglodytarum]|uniref:Uncharacterized protein n=1 Tax=Musa troglodytarum TaxID=320322 RepID=A0A9E7JTN1_9LILI|nr:hypothetical protein MUK42_33414 [Musa troglodytarum]
MTGRTSFLAHRHRLPLPLPDSLLGRGLPIGRAPAVLSLLLYYQGYLDASYTLRCDPGGGARQICFGNSSSSSSSSCCSSTFGLFIEIRKFSSGAPELAAVKKNERTIEMGFDHAIRTKDERMI